MKVHVALNTPRFDESVRFYRTFLGLKPVKLKPGYAKFDVAEPALNLTLNASSDVGGGALNQAQMLRHSVDHSTYHRGQVVTLLRQVGAVPPNRGLIVFYRRT